MELYGVVFDEKSISDVFDIVSKHKACVKECVFKKYFSEMYDNIMEIDFPDGFTFAQKIFHYLRNDNDFKLGLCKTCGKRTSFLGFTKGYRPYCNSICMGKDTEFWEKHKKTNIERYGCEFAAQSQKVKDKIKNTNVERYGVESVFESEEIKNKIKNTNVERYGCEHYNNPQGIKKSLLKKSEDEWKSISEMRKNTNLERYGVDQPLLNKDIINNIKNKNIERYGVDWSSKRQDVREKISTTKLNYSKEKNDTINEKRKNTNLERYGVEFVSKLDENKLKSFETKRNNTLKKYPFVKNIVNDRFICSCTDNDCNMCSGKEFEITRGIYVRRMNDCTELCPIKNPIDYSISNEEIGFRKFIEDIYDGEIVYNNRDLLDGKEIDIYIPDLKIGFEFNGLYFHSEYFKEKDYHKQKSLLAMSKGITLIHVWEDDWFTKKNIIKDIIKSKLGLFDKKIGARSCELREISSEEAREFINETHLQGYVNSKIKIGLFYKNELVGVTTFGKLRNFMKSSGNNTEYELYRFCYKKGMSIIGGFQKMLNYFINNYSPSKIITYASLDISNGSIYEKSGFTFIRNTEPGYYWVNDSKENKEEFLCRKHRFNFRKSELIKLGFDKNKTEDEIMHERKYFKCYDSGNAFFEMIIQNKNEN